MHYEIRKALQSSWRDCFWGIEDEPDKATRDVSLNPNSGKEAPYVVNSLDQATLNH